MNENAVDLKARMRAAGITRERAAAMLYVTIDTLHQWLKPVTSRNANPCPRWAVELMAFKTRLDPETIQKVLSAEIAPSFDGKPLP